MLLNVGSGGGAAAAPTGGAAGGATADAPAEEAKEEKEEGKPRNSLFCYYANTFPFLQKKRNPMKIWALASSIEHPDLFLWQHR